MGNGESSAQSEVKIALRNGLQGIINQKLESNNKINNITNITRLDKEEGNALYMEKIHHILSTSTNDKHFPRPEYIDKDDNWLLLGGFYSSKLIENYTKNYNITHVINMAEGDSGNPIERRKAHTDLDINYIAFPAEDSAEYRITTHWGDIKKFIDEYLKLSSSSSIDNTYRGRLLIHCMAGVNRSASLAIAIICYTEKKTLFEAVAQVREKKGHILTNIYFRNDLINWGREEGCLEIHKREIGKSNL